LSCEGGRPIADNASGRGTVTVAIPGWRMTHLNLVPERAVTSIQSLARSRSRSLTYTAMSQLFVSARTAALVMNTAE
jgi:hypothetical protein